MTIESVVIIIVGFAATVFLLSFSWWLWTRAPAPAPRTQAPRVVGPPLGPPPGADQWMGWAQPGVPSAPPSPERERFEQSTLVPVTEFMPNGDEGDLDRARTMFFLKKEPEQTEILSDALDLEFGQASATQRPPPPRRSLPPPPPPPPSK
ncbi:hypothetical protein DB30_01359 [Enhygromyxa salina]|uniref:Uncharacterized protein n=1 Tax=Enhygromyxa salina TaxID=215803 RepID=A0A0C2D9K3_9BACT|nr:hypothetical protein [Enhygromyxa salina]KIG18250.1 hypothetical protein DB30_01359 [Enhygromyxa salina]